MAIARSLAEIPFDTLKPGQHYFLIDFTPEMMAQARQLIDARAKALGGYRGIIRRDSTAPIMFIGPTKELLAQRATQPKDDNPPGRPLGIEARLLAALEVGASTDLSAKGRTSTSIRNLVTRTAKRHRITLQASSMDSGEYFRVTRIG